MNLKLSRVDRNRLACTQGKRSGGYQMKKDIVKAVALRFSLGYQRTWSYPLSGNVESAVGNDSWAI